MSSKSLTKLNSKCLSLALLAALFLLSVNGNVVHAKVANADDFTWWTEKQPNGHCWVKAKMLIQATTDIVWQAIHNEQNADQDLVYRKVLNQGTNEVTSEQKLAHLPIIGTATSTMHTTEVPLKRIDYEMVKSDRFKALEGSWVLSPGPNKSTYLELSSYCDIGIPIPRPIHEGITVKKLEKRLDNVKRHSEFAQVQIAGKQYAERQAERLN